MKLRLRRSQYTTGVANKSVLFGLYARVELSQEEKHNVDKYKLANQVLYSSEAARKHQATAAAHASSGGVFGLLKGIAAGAVATMALHITINSLMRGQMIQGKSLDEIIAAEEAVREGCKNMKAYIEVASQFDGKEEVIEI